MATKECAGFTRLYPFPCPSGRVGKVAAEIFVETARTFAIVLQIISWEAEDCGEGADVKNQKQTTFGENDSIEPRNTRNTRKGIAAKRGA